MNNSSNPHVISTNDTDFERDVMLASADILVVVDFWAEWCGPCRMLGPELETLATDYNGQFRLVKANTEQTASAAQQFGVSSIPAVFAVFDGKILDSFVGALAQAQLRPWLERLLKVAELNRAEKIESEDPVAAEAIYREHLQVAPNETETIIGLARTLLHQNRADECQELIDQIAANGYLPPEAEKLRTEIELQGLKSEDVTSLKKQLEANPDDTSLQVKLAEVLAAHQEFTEAFDLLLDLVSRERHGIGETAREKLVEMFRLLPDDSELLSEYRRKLSMLLY